MDWFSLWTISRRTELTANGDGTRWPCRSFDTLTISEWEPKLKVITSQVHQSSLFPTLIPLNTLLDSKYTGPGQLSKIKNPEISGKMKPFFCRCQKYKAHRLSKEARLSFLPPNYLMVSQPFSLFLCCGDSSFTRIARPWVAFIS